MEKIPTLYIANVKSLNFDKNFEIAYNLVSKERQDRVDRIIPKDKKLLSLASELVLRNALIDQNLIAKGDELPSIAYNKNGKPYIKDNSNIHFSISHSGDYTICAIADTPIGCDIQKITFTGLEIKTAKKHFSQSEYEDIAMQETERKQIDRFYRYWTLKESYIKTVGGRLEYLKNFEIKLGFTPKIIIKNDKVLQKGMVNDLIYTLTECDKIAEYKCAICQETNSNAQTKICYKNIYVADMMINR